MQFMSMTTVLLLHKVTDGDWFEELIGWLRRRFQLVPVEYISEYYAGARSSATACHITFDDGDTSFADVVLPVLKRQGVCASLFVSPKICVDGGNYWFQEIMGWDVVVARCIAARVLNVPGELLESYSVESILKAMPLRQINDVMSIYRNRPECRTRSNQNLSVNVLQEIAASGLVSIGAHTMGHPILANEDDAFCGYEIAASVRDLSRILGRPVEQFAYPNGIPGLDFGEREGKILRSCGIRLAFTTESRHLTGTDDTLRIPRIAISDGEMMRFVEAKIVLGSNWNRLKRIAGRGEYVERRRLSSALSGFRSMDGN